MERTCFLMEIVPGMEEEYGRRHDEIWPEMLSALSDAGMTNYSLFRRGTTVIAYAECHPDAATVFARLDRSNVNARWSRWFEDVLVQHTDVSRNHSHAAEVWHMDCVPHGRETEET